MDASRHVAIGAPCQQPDGRVLCVGRKMSLYWGVQGLEREGGYCRGGAAFLERLAKLDAWLDIAARVDQAAAQRTHQQSSCHALGSPARRPKVLGCSCVAARTANALPGCCSRCAKDKEFSVNAANLRVLMQLIRATCPQHVSRSPLPTTFNHVHQRRNAC